MEAADWIKALTPLAVALIAAPVAAWLAARVAMHRWRVEIIAKRRAEIAEAVLADLLRVRYQVESVFPKAWARVRGDEDAEVADQITRRMVEAVVDLEARRFSFAAVFSEAEAEPLEEIPSIVREFYGDDNEGGFVAIDPAGKAKLDAVVGAIERVCRPAIRAASASKPWWRVW